MPFLIGQRVIVDQQIVTVVAHTNADSCLEEYEVKFVCGLVQFRRPMSLKPLPNGQM